MYVVSYFHIFLVFFFSTTNEYNIALLMMKWKLIDIKQLSSTSNFSIILYTYTYHLGYPFIIRINWKTNFACKFFR